ncbi:hypothetical protein [Clostridium sp. LP20]|uniref:hypothetical protein n=1 Tax=Clostridium sp. LP20 TaxID=3418665 RepID=UPI003EE7AE5F
MKKLIFKGATLSLVVIGILIIINPIFIKKVSHKAKLYQGLYNKENKYDILLFGSSHMNSSISPNILWEKYGMTSFNYGTGGQPIDVTYHLMKEALKNHSESKVVVLDVYYLGLTDEYGTEGYIRYVLDNMKLSSNKIEAIKNSTPKDERLSYLFPILKYHSRWSELEEGDFNFNLESGRESKGFGAGRNIYGKENKSNLEDREIGDIPPKSEEYLNKL